MPAIIDLTTPEQRLHYGTWQFRSGYPEHNIKLLESKGFTAEEIEQCWDAAKAQQDEERGWRAWYGNPEYGGWVTDKRDGRHKPMQLIPEEFQQ